MKDQCNDLLLTSLIFWAKGLSKGAVMISNLRNVMSLINLIVLCTNDNIADFILHVNLVTIKLALISSCLKPVIGLQEETELGRTLSQTSKVFYVLSLIQFGIPKNSSHPLQPRRRISGDMEIITFIIYM